jgi:type II secretory pathway pseudopilin PulG
LFEHRPARKRERVPRRERGFALLLVFALAASVAILIYLEIPRVAFERQRDKEALLIDRGEQYARAIELYARKMNKYPQTLDDLEKAQTVRFLRRRYKDPMTGKDEWRLVHMNANGQYVDSKVHKAAGALDKQDSGPSILASKFQGVGASATVISQDGQGASAALQKRASDRISPGGPRRQFPGRGSKRSGGRHCGWQ